MVQLPYKPSGPNSSWQSYLLGLATIAWGVVIPIIGFDLSPKTPLGWLALLAAAPLLLILVILFMSLAELLGELLWSLPLLTWIRISSGQHEPGVGRDIVRLGVSLVAAMVALTVLILGVRGIGSSHGWLPERLKAFLAENYQWGV